MWNTPTGQQLDRIPRLYGTKHISPEEKLIYLHFFIGGCDWYIAEYDGDDLFFGFAILNNDYEMAEWGETANNRYPCFHEEYWCNSELDITAITSASENALLLIKKCVFSYENSPWQQCAPIAQQDRATAF